MVDHGAAQKVAMHEISPTRRQGGALRALLTPNRVGATAGFMGVLTVRPGEVVSEHYHPYSDKFMFVVRGELTVRLDGGLIKLDGNDALMVRRGARHRLQNTGSDETFVVFYLGPLAPRPQLGHVDTEAPPHPDEPVPEVGGVS